jgi:hypothetical protein
MGKIRSRSFFALAVRLTPKSSAFGDPLYVLTFLVFNSISGSLKEKPGTLRLLIFRFPLCNLIFEIPEQNVTFSS